MSTQQSTLVFAPRQVGGSRGAVPTPRKSTKTPRAKHAGAHGAAKSEHRTVPTTATRMTHTPRATSVTRNDNRTRTRQHVAEPSKRERVIAGSTAAGAAVARGAHATAAAVGNVAHGAKVGARANWRSLVIAGVILIAIVWAFAAPLRTYYCAVRDQQIYRAELAAVEQHNQELSDAVTTLQTREGIEDAARKRGYVGEGETSVEMQGVDPEKEVSGSKVKTTLPPNPWYIDVLDGLFGYTSPLGANE